VQEHHIGVQRTARYYVLGGDVAAPQEIWVVCHGYAQLARYFLRAFEPLNDGTRTIVAPEALNRYYFETAPGVHGRDARVAATWMTREDRDHEITDYTAYLDALAARLRQGSAARVEARIIALGFSQGAATVSRWVARGVTDVADIVLWGSSVAHDLELRPDLFRGARLTLALGDADQHISEQRVEREGRRLRDAGLQYRLLRYNGGHRIEPAALAALTVTGWAPPT
jgi:predicted esterase